MNILKVAVLPRGQLLSPASLNVLFRHGVRCLFTILASAVLPSLGQAGDVSKNEVHMDEIAVRLRVTPEQLANGQFRSAWRELRDDTAAPHTYAAVDVTRKNLPRILEIFNPETLQPGKDVRAYSEFLKVEPLLRECMIPLRYHRPPFYDLVQDLEDAVAFSNAEIDQLSAATKVGFRTLVDHRLDRVSRKIAKCPFSGARTLERQLLWLRFKPGERTAEDLQSILGSTLKADVLNRWSQQDTLAANYFGGKWWRDDVE